MKRFDPEAIKSRLLDRMRVKLNWALVSENGTLSALLDTFADGHAELARYAEYLLAEKKWTTAQNITSLTTQVGLIGRKPHRKRSAISQVIVAHTDENGTNRLQNFGRTFFNLDDRSNYDNISRDPDPQNIFRTQTLVPWTYDTPYVVPKYTRFLTSSGTEFVSTASVASRALKEPWDIILNDRSRYQAFLDAGGWMGIKFLKVPIIQGKIKTYIFGNATGERFESLLLPVPNCEDATNSVSKDFLKIFVNLTPAMPDAKEEWVQVNSLLLAGPYDRVFEVNNLPDYSGVLFKFGDGINGQRLPIGAEVSVQYLETAGEKGNVDRRYQVTDIIYPEGYEMIDPRTRNLAKFLSVTNISPILGGREEENEDELRDVAPLDYLKYYAIATTQAYENQIQQYAQIGLDKVKVFSGNRITQSNTSFDQGANTSALNLNIAQNVLYVTAISANGERIEDAEHTLIEPVAKAIGDLKAPSDTLAYIDPNFIRMKLNTIVYSSSTDMSDEDIIALERQALSDTYSIFNRNFRQPFYNSEYIHLVTSFPFVDYVETQVEAVADLRIQSDQLVRVPSRSATLVTPQGNRNVTYPTLYKFAFRFDKLFAQNPYSRGFKNYMQNAPSLLRIDLRFINDPRKAARLNRTFFLYDHRNIYEGGSIPTLAQGKYLMTDGTSVVTNGAGLQAWVRPEDTLEDYNDRTVRVAQFPFLEQITDDKTMLSRVKASDKTPVEIRPYITDSEGRNRIYRMDEVTWPANEPDPRIPLPGGTQCYRRDWRFINYFDIEFNENYEDPDSTEYAFGYIVLPGSYFEFGNIDINNESQFIGSARNFVSLKVYAQPLLQDIEPELWNEIIFCDDEDIVVERVRPRQ
jgi:hypothetical protein